MIPGMDPRMMKQAMKKMGIAQKELDAQKVVISLEDKDLIFENPSVTKVNMMGQDSYQISGKAIEVAREEPKGLFSDEDIETVMEQTQATKEQAVLALEESGGDLACAIMGLKSKDA